MNLKMSLGQTVRQRRIELGLNQCQLAERMSGNVQQADISRIERGYLPWPRPDLLQRLAKGLSMSPVELITLSGWMTESEYEHYRALYEPQITTDMPLAICGSSESGDGLLQCVDSALIGRFRTLIAFDGGTLLDSMVAQTPELVIVSQDCPRVQLDQMEAVLESNHLSTKVIVVGHRRAAVPRDMRFHYLKAPATPAAIGSLLGAMGYRSVPAA